MQQKKRKRFIPRGYPRNLAPTPPGENKLVLERVDGATRYTLGRILSSGGFNNVFTIKEAWVLNEAGGFFTVAPEPTPASGLVNDGITATLMLGNERGATTEGGDNDYKRMSEVVRLTRPVKRPGRSPARWYHDAMIAREREMMGIGISMSLREKGGSVPLTIDAGSYKCGGPDPTRLTNLWSMPELLPGVCYAGDEPHGAQGRKWIEKCRQEYRFMCNNISPESGDGVWEIQERFHVDGFDMYVEYMSTPYPYFSNPKEPLSEVFQACSRLFNTLSLMHNMGDGKRIIHNDVKLENIGMYRNRREGWDFTKLVLLDYGLVVVHDVATMWGEDAATKPPWFDTLLTRGSSDAWPPEIVYMSRAGPAPAVGTPYFIAGYDGTQKDIWPASLIALMFILGHKDNPLEKFNKEREEEEEEDSHRIVWPDCDLVQRALNGEYDNMLDKDKLYKLYGIVLENSFEARFSLCKVIDKLGTDGDLDSLDSDPKANAQTRAIRLLLYACWRDLSNPRGCVEAQARCSASALRDAFMEAMFESDEEL